MKKSTKKLVSVLLASAMAAGMLAGCGSGNGKGSTGDSKSSSAASGTSGDNLSADTSEHVDLTMYLIGDRTPDFDEVYAKINEILEEKLNCSLNVEFLSWGEHDTKYSLLFSSQEDFDLIFTASSWCHYEQTVSLGGFAPLSEDFIKTYAPDIWEVVPEMAWEQAKIDGQIYMVPSYANEFGQEVLAVRGDLMEKYGMDDITSWDDLMKFYKACAADGIYASQGGPWYPFFQSQGYSTTGGAPKGGELILYHTQDPKDLEFQYIGEWDAFHEYCQEMKDLVDAGAWSSDVLNSSDERQTGLLTGRTASMSWNLGTCLTYGKQANEEHPDWILSTPGRNVSVGRHQLVLDFSREEVVEGIYGQMEKLLKEAPISYVKWDMNRSISEIYSHGSEAEKQGSVFHKYILGVYHLYEKLTEQFPEILFESCASGGARFDPGLLYYAPQCWTSDDTDAVERLKIQYGTSFVYPVSSMGSHVSAVPNHQVLRNTPLNTRANVAYFGTFGYELDVTSMEKAELEEIKEQIVFMKAHRELIQKGTFYRLKSPFEGNVTAWMVVSEDQSQALVGYYRVLEPVNAGFERLHLAGLKEGAAYQISDRKEILFGDELMQAGLVVSDAAAGQNGEKYNGRNGDYQSRLYFLQEV